MLRSSDIADASLATDLPSQILSRAAEDPSAVWTPGDFADIAGRAAIDKTLQRLATNGELRRIGSTIARALIG
jgi:hypothetical protein